MTVNPAEVFRSAFGKTPDVCAFAPGRVNLIGEHTDYNGGLVFPCALDLGIYGAARLRDDNTLRFYSADFPEGGTAALSLLSLPDGWMAYPAAVIKTFAAMGYPLDRGADFAFTGNLPDGAGLSSSAALEVLTSLLLRALYGFSVTAQELAVFGQFAENRFIGVNCGIMDQFASALGKKGSAILLDSATLDYTYAPVPADKTTLVIVNSGVKHSLASSAYNDRRRACEEALDDINKVQKTASLCALSAEAFDVLQDKIRDPVCRKRAKHAVYESLRTKQAADALKSRDLVRFGKLMRASHLSLRDDYEVSCAALDFLAETAWSLEGVYGARMTGGGFGGCTVNLVEKAYVNSFTETVKKKYKEKFGINAETYVAEAGDGARVLER